MVLMQEERGRETVQCMMRCIEPKLLAFPLYSAGGEDGLQSLLGTENFSAQNIVYLATKRREIKTWYEFIEGGWFVLRFSHMFVHGGSFGLDGKCNRSAYVR